MMQLVSWLTVILQNFNISIIKEWIVDQGNKLAAGSPLLTKEVLSVTAMKGNTFVTELADSDHIMIHYADKTKDIFTISPKRFKSETSERVRYCRTW